MRAVLRELFFVSACLVWLAGAGCRPSSADPHTAQTHPPPPSSGEARRHAGRGVIREIPQGRSSLVVRHEAIPGFMPRMVMDLKLGDPKEAAGLDVGDEITFDLVTTDAAHWLENVRRTGTRETVAASRVAGDVSAPSGMLRVGDEMPDVELLTEEGKRVRLSEFRGRAVAMTFIFTRCPIPDFCPRMNRNFSQARRLLKARREPGVAWQFLSVSFDPEYDRPEALARYAAGYRGGDATGWLFAAASKPMLQAVAPRLDLMVRREGEAISHNLRTVVMDARGRIHRQFDGNEWTPEDLATAMTQASQLREDASGVAAGP